MKDDPVIRISARPESSAAPKQKARGLGRGLGALLGESRREEPLVAQDPGERATVPADGRLAMLAIADISPHPSQPRRHFDEEALDELAASIAQRGVIQPVIVRVVEDGRYQLVAGERRWRAAQRAQLHEIPALVRKLSDRDVMALALIENLQREDLNPIEEARAYHVLAQEEGLTQAEIARMVDKSRSHVANFQRLLTLPDEVIEHVEKGDLSMGHARCLIGSAEAESIARLAIDKQLSVRDLERLVRRRSQDDRAPRRKRTERISEADADIVAVQGHLEEFLGLPVRISADADPRSGAITIRYSTLDQLDLICQRLTGGSI